MYQANKLNKAKREEKRREEHRQMALIFMIGFMAVLLILCIFLVKGVR